MQYTISASKELFLGETGIENIFISELMPGAPEDFLKIYLYAYMYVKAGKPLTDTAICKELGVSEDRLSEAWNFWEERGAVKCHYLPNGNRYDFVVNFLSLREAMYGEPLSELTEVQGPDVETTGVFGNEAVSTLIKETAKKLGRTLSASEMQKIISWVEDLNMPPEAVYSAVEYCTASGKTSLRYIEKVVCDWSGKNLKTKDSIQEYLEDIDKKYYRYRRIMKALGFSRNAGEEEKRLMDSWFDDLGFSMDKVLEACAKTAGISNPNIKYVNSVLNNWAKDAKAEGRSVNENKPVSLAVLNKYYDYLRQKAEKEAAKRREEVYAEIPQIEEIDKKIRRIGAELSRVLVAGDTSGRGRELSEEMEKLDEDRAYLLAESDYDMDYTDVRYICKKCNDTGMTDMGERCSCIEKRMQEAEEWQMQKEKNGEELTTDV